MGKLIDLTGQKFGRLTVIERAENKCNRPYWFCVCDCGERTLVRGNHLMCGNVKSCGCYVRDVNVKTHTTHGFRKSRLWRVWRSMLQRCTNEKHKSYKSYGSRGVEICAEWRCDFKAFCEWSVNNGYSDELSIDRIDNNREYSPSNCRWVTMKQQERNRRNNRLLSFNGKTQCVAAWSEELCIKYTTLMNRIKKYGWSVERALTTPVNM